MEERKKRVEKEVKMSLKRQSIDKHRLKGVKKNKPCKDGKFTKSLDYVYYCVFFEFFDFERAKYRETFHCMDC